MAFLILVHALPSELSKPHESGRVWLGPLCSVDIYSAQVCKFHSKRCPTVAIKCGHDDRCECSPNTTGKKT